MRGLFVAGNASVLPPPPPKGCAGGGARRIVAASGVRRARWVSLPRCLNQAATKSKRSINAMGTKLSAPPNNTKEGGRDTRLARVLARARVCSREMSILWKAPPYPPLSRTVYTQPATSAVGYYCLRICVFTRAHARAAVWRNTERACRSHPLARFLRGRFHCVCAGAVVSRVSFVLTAREARQEHGTSPCDCYHALRDGNWKGKKKSKFSFGAVRV